MADADVGWLHAQAIHGLLVGATPYPVYLGEVTTPDEEIEYPYLVAWPPPATRPTITLAGYGGEATTTTQVTASGRDVRETITAMDRASAALHRRRPVIAGRKCGLIRHLPDAAGPPQPTRDPQLYTPARPVFFTFAQFALMSSPLDAPDPGGS